MRQIIKQSDTDDIQTCKIKQIIQIFQLKVSFSAVTAVNLSVTLLLWPFILDAKGENTDEIWQQYASSSFDLTFRKCFQMRNSYLLHLSFQKI